MMHSVAQRLQTPRSGHETTRFPERAASDGHRRPELNERSERLSSGDQEVLFNRSPRSQIPSGGAAGAAGAAPLASRSGTRRRFTRCPWLANTGAAGSHWWLYWENWEDWWNWQPHQAAWTPSTSGCSATCLLSPMRQWGGLVAGGWWRGGDRNTGTRSKRSSSLITVEAGRRRAGAPLCWRPVNQSATSQSVSPTSSQSCSPPRCLLRLLPCQSSLLLHKH